MVEHDGGSVALAAETTVFLAYFIEMPERRHPGKVLYLLDEVLLLCLLAVLPGGLGQSRASAKSTARRPTRHASTSPP